MAKEICKEKECEACGAWFTPSRSNVKYCPDCRIHSDQIVRQMERNTQHNIELYGYGQKPKKSKMSAKNAEKSLFHIFNLKTFAAKDVGIPIL